MRTYSLIQEGDSTDLSFVEDRSSVESTTVKRSSDVTGCSGGKQFLQNAVQSRRVSLKRATKYLATCSDIPVAIRTLCRRNESSAVEDGGEVLALWTSGS